MTMPLSQQCTATKKNGKRCTGRALPDRDVCVTHVRGALAVDEITVLKGRLLSLTKSKNPRVAANAALTLGRLLAKFPPKSATAKDGDMDLRQWTPDERRRLTPILDQLRALKAEVKARLHPEDVPVVLEVKPAAAPPIAPVATPSASNPNELVGVVTANGPQRLTRRQLDEGWRVE
jgi:hypothetical protein